MTAERRVPLLVVDLDGTVRHGRDELGRFVNTPEDIIIFPEALELLRRWKQGGGRIIAVSNQGGIALGHMTMSQCAATMTRTWLATEHLIEKLVWCSSAPNSVESAYGPQGVYSLPAESIGADPSVVPAVQYRVCTRAASTATQEAGHADAISASDIPIADLCGSAWLFGRDHRWRGHDHGADEADWNQALPGGSADDIGGDNLLAWPWWWNGLEAADPRHAQAAMGMAGDWPRERAGDPDRGPAIPDHQTGQGDRGAGLYRDSAGSLTYCWCRKPSPGLLIEAALDLAHKHGEIYPPYMGLMGGDRDEDEQCARLAGFDFMWAKDWRGQVSLP